ncbi:MAG TPA: stage IV sporulation protein A [Candidatus Merdicola faecigallinarum]|uniref:Stage IV sporulation protein A n=1 Tax=Candidatus Merdicola faecigallinarum TaxID=2840862 RepID=A0A9D1M086_9FIRM|nr:stage IV sporulation protein A [Candidatus Merdicola faecigallinarum]
MENRNVYEDIAKRTDGDIYVGVVGPVRTGKSTFIKKFMDLLVIPNIENEYKKERAKDELPQSAAGRTIMTTEPKFIPNEAVEITVGENIRLKTRLVDCVGYLVNNAIGYLEDDMPRMVKTPWSEEEIPFEQAAEIGTKKVIEEHSTIGIVMTTDGSITDIPREDYIEAEERVIKELKQFHKPFVIVLNSEDPYSEYTTSLAKKLEDKYETPVLALNCIDLTIDDINSIFERILYEFPIDRININFPKWVDGLENTHPLRMELLKEIQTAFQDASILKQIDSCVSRISQTEIITKTRIEQIQLGSGSVDISIELKENLFYSILTEISGVEINNEGDLFSTITTLAQTQKEYNKIAYALEEVKAKGYGIVTPSMDELILEEPEMVKQGSRFGVKLKAKAPSIHMIRTNVETEVSPIVGSEKQSEELVNYLLSEFESDPKKIWESNIFGKSLHELVNEGLQNKLSKMPEDAQGKLQETLERIVNEGSGGLICIIL